MGHPEAGVGAGAGVREAQRALTSSSSKSAAERVRGSMTCKQCRSGLLSCTEATRHRKSLLTEGNEKVLSECSVMPEGLEKGILR